VDEKSFLKKKKRKKKKRNRVRRGGEGEKIKLPKNKLRSGAEKGQRKKSQAGMAQG